MENVYNIERMPVLPKATKIFKDAGYGPYHNEFLTASYCCRPQARMPSSWWDILEKKRRFLGELLDGRQSENPMTVYDYLGDSLHGILLYASKSYNRAL
jgi:DNA (cytosine-5)-methyltransferase 1